MSLPQEILFDFFGAADSTGAATVRVLSSQLFSASPLS
jgi:hypothetical protein